MSAHAVPFHCPYCGYENYEFDIPTTRGCDCYGRYVIRVEEMKQSLTIVEHQLGKGHWRTDRARVELAQTVAH